jgi:hypothetical protein
MSNTWSYSVILDSENPLSDRVLAAATQTLSALDYSFWNPVVHKITGMSGDGLHELEFDDWDAARAYLVVHGGSITFWRAQDESNCSDLGLTFAPHDREISLSVVHDLRKERQDDVQVAADLQTLFAALCQRLNPVYGYSTDEYKLESVFSDTEIQAVTNDLRRAVRMLDPPPALFWLNYFGQKYFDRIPGSSFQDLSFRKQVASQGVFVFLCEYPWDVKVARLQSSGKYRLI